MHSRILARNPTIHSCHACTPLSGMNCPGVALSEGVVVDAALTTYNVCRHIVRDF